MPKEQLKVLIVDDHQLMIEGLRSLLEDEEGIGSVAGANSMEETLTFLEKNLVDVVLMDINMPEVSGIEITQKIRENYPDIKVIALTMHDDISIITRMIKAGASGYILKKTNMNEVIDALNIVHAGGKYLSMTTQNIIMDNLIKTVELMEGKEERNMMISSR